ncbi:hypothetical protein DL96DRAFT_1620930, partial [Flagelloscypha sp. PMI_526]
ILNLRMVNAMFRDVVPKHYLHRRFLDLTGERVSSLTHTSSRVRRKHLEQSLPMLSDPCASKWYTTLKVSPHLEYSGERPHGFGDVTMSWLLERTPFPEKLAKTLNKTLCTRVLPSLPNITTLVIIEGGFSIPRAIKGSTPVPPRCSYFDVIWSQYSATLTTLEIIIYRENTWPCYCPAEGLVFPSLMRLRVMWDMTASWPNVAAILASKSPGLEELGLYVTDDHPDNADILPDDPKSLSRLRIFRWMMPGSYSRTPTCVLLFLKAFTPQLIQLSIRTWNPLSDEVVLDISKLRLFSFEIGRGSASMQTMILEQLETPGLCRSLVKLVLRCVNWPIPQAQRLLGALAHLNGTLKELTLFLPLYCTDWLIRIARSMPRLESLYLVIGKGWRIDDRSGFTHTIPHSVFAQEVLSLGIQSLELRTWKLLDLTIRPQFNSAQMPELNIELMRAISSVVPSIYSFYALGHMRFDPTDERRLFNVENRPKDGYMSNWSGEDL